MSVGNKTKKCIPDAQLVRRLRMRRVALLARAVRYASRGPIRDSRNM